MNIKRTYSLNYADDMQDTFYNLKDVLYSKDGYWYINNTPTYISTSTIPPATNYSYFIQGGSTWNEKFNILEQRLNNITADISYWDIYKIKTQVTDKDDVDVVFNNLKLGESLVINTSGAIDYVDANKNSIALSRGDVLIKTSDGDAIVVKALTQGIYYPQAIIKNGNSYTINYAFSSVLPQEGINVCPVNVVGYYVAADNAFYTDAEHTTVIIPQLNIVYIDLHTNVPYVWDGTQYVQTEVQTEPKQTIQFTQIEDSIKNQPYNLLFATYTDPSNHTISFSAIKLGTSPNQTILRPIVKIIAQSNDAYEEVYLDYTLTESNGTFTFTSTALADIPNWRVLFK